MRRGASRNRWARKSRAAQTFPWVRVPKAQGDIAGLVGALGMARVSRGARSLLAWNTCNCAVRAHALPCARTFLVLVHGRGSPLVPWHMRSRSPCLPTRLTKRRRSRKWRGVAGYRPQFEFSCRPATAAGQHMGQQVSRPWASVCVRGSRGSSTRAMDWHCACAWVRWRAGTDAYQPDIEQTNNPRVTRGLGFPGLRVRVWVGLHWPWCT